MRKKGIKAMGNNGIELERDGFKSRTGFILACIGSAVGMGNIWRFPYMVSAWGGMTFLIPYVLFVILIGSTGVILSLIHIFLKGNGTCIPSWFSCI